MTESYPVFTPRQDEKFALHGCFEHSTVLPRVRRPSHNDFRQILPSQFPKEFSNSSIFFWFWGSRVREPNRWNGQFLIDFPAGIGNAGGSSKSRERANHG